MVRSSLVSVGKEQPSSETQQQERAPCHPTPCPGALRSFEPGSSSLGCRGRRTKSTTLDPRLLPEGASWHGNEAGGGSTGYPQCPFHQARIRTTQSPFHLCQGGSVPTTPLEPTDPQSRPHLHVGLLKSDAGAALQTQQAVLVPGWETGTGAVSLG